MVVVYYVLTHFLDAALETIQSIKQSVQLHIVIELTPFSKKSTIIDVHSLDHLNAIENCENLLGEEKWKHLRHYFEGVASVNFAVFKNKQSFSLQTIITGLKVNRFIKSIDPQIIHFDSISPRVLALLPLLLSRKMFITVHDPKPHTGERSWQNTLTRFVFFKMVKGFFFYSQFSCQEFMKYYDTTSRSLTVLRFQPFTYLTQLDCSNKQQSGTILFFGRLSKYKGIDLLLEAIPQIIKRYPDQKFVIAGSTAFNYQILPEKIIDCKNNVEFIPKYLTVDELVQLINDAKFLVCPYRDATQSGVLMTAFASKKMVVATNVGAFPEYIIDGVNGLLAEPTADDVAAKILYALENENYLKMEAAVNSTYSKQIECFNRNSLLSTYTA